MITFEGEAHCIDVDFGGGVTVADSAVQFWATDCQFQSLTLDAGDFQSLFLANTYHTDDLTINGDASFQAVVISGLNMTGGNLVVNGSFGYGFKFDGNIRLGSVTLTDLDDAVLDLEVIELISLTLDTCNRNKLDLLIREASQHGLIITDSSDNRFSGMITNAGRQTTNTYDGYFMDGDSNRNHLALTVTYEGAGNQMRYGGNISAGTCDDNVESSILTGSGATGNFNNAGTGTVLTDEHIV